MNDFYMLEQVHSALENLTLMKFIGKLDGSVFKLCELMPGKIEKQKHENR